LWILTNAWDLKLNNFELQIHFEIWINLEFFGGHIRLNLQISYIIGEKKTCVGELN
jgi:hypothetical protein